MNISSFFVSLVSINAASLCCPASFQQAHGFGNGTVLSLLLPRPFYFSGIAALQVRRFLAAPHGLIAAWNFSTSPHAAFCRKFSAKGCFPGASLVARAQIGTCRLALITFTFRI